MVKILVVDDQPDIRWLLSNLLKEQGWEVATASEGEEALEVFRKEAPAAVLLDLKMPRLGGMQVLERIKRHDPHTPVIVITAYGEVASAVQAMKLGAYDYLTKPFNNDDLIFTIKRALEKQALIAQVEDLKGQLESEAGLSMIMGAGQTIRKVFEQVRQVARTNFSVILQGETGTGKEILARAIHSQSLRREGPFVAVDCGAIPEPLLESELFGYEKGAFTGAQRRKEGHFALASGGTLFLDEITNLPPASQYKLLRVLQERLVLPVGATRPIKVDFRVIAATNVPLEAEVKAGRFRQDLYHRLNEFTITIPPLRERKEDILHLAKRFVDETAMELKKRIRGLSEEAVERLMSYPWPGNVRELRNVIRRATLLAEETIEAEHLSALGTEEKAIPSWFDSKPSLEEGLSLKALTERAVAQVEKQAILHALRETRGNKAQAAKLLQIDYKTLYNKLKQYGIPAREFLP